MALSERDVELINLTAEKAVHTILAETEPQRRMMAREEAWAVSDKAIAAHADNCKEPDKRKMSNLKITMMCLARIGGTGIATNADKLLAVAVTLLR